MTFKPEGKPYPTSDSKFRIVSGAFGTWDCGKRIVYGPFQGEPNCRLYTWEPKEPALEWTPEQWIDAAIGTNVYGGK